MAKVTDIQEQLRQAITNSGETLYAIAKGSGADYSVLLRYMSRERGISLATAARLARHLKLELRKAKAR